MTGKTLIGVTVAAVVVTALAAPAALAFGRHHNHGGDPYAYRHEPRGYYPYYSSHYWRPAHKVRRRPGIKAPKYYPAWGYYNRDWNHRDWHARHHGRHSHKHW